MAEENHDHNSRTWPKVIFMLSAVFGSLAVIMTAVILVGA